MLLSCGVVRPKIRAFVPRRKNRATQWTSPADATSKRVYCRLRKPGDSDLLGGRASRTANWASFYRQKTHYQHVTYGLQSDWLHVCKAILLVQTSRAFCSNVEQSYWYKWRGLLFKLRRPWAFYWVHIDGLTPGHPMGAENPTISRETETQVPAACQPQTRQPHIIKLIPQLQKPTRKISDTWIIDTCKRETRYQLVKIHQTIRQPHSVGEGSWQSLGLQGDPTSPS